MEWESATENEKLTDYTDDPKSWAVLQSCLSNLESAELYCSNIICGRSENCDITIKYPMVTKEHFIISRKNGNGYNVFDLSKNGTFLNGTLIGKGLRRDISHEDVISVGHKHFKVFVFRVRHGTNATDGQLLPQILDQKYVVGGVIQKTERKRVLLAFDKLGPRNTAYIIKNTIKPNFPTKDLVVKSNTLKTLSFPFIVDVKEVFESINEIYVVTEYMKGGDLIKRVDSLNLLLEPQIKVIFYQIMLALRYLHGKKIIHQNLKPENIMLTSSEDINQPVKLTDMKLLPSEVGSFDNYKTAADLPNFVAPEILDPHSSKYDEKVDVWSLGEILYYMFYKTPPFKGLNRQIQNCHLADVITARNKIHEVPFLVQDLIRKMLVIDPHHRISLEDVFKHPWIEQDISMQFQVNRIKYDVKESKLHHMYVENPSKRIKLFE